MTVAMRRTPRWICAGLALACGTCRAGPSLYGTAATVQEIRFGGSVGSGATWTPGTPQDLAGAGFGGHAALSCSGLDYGGFLSAYDAGEFLREMRNQFMAGAQAAAMNYLIVLAYSNPTIASVLDTMNRSYSAKFGSFELSCNAQQARRQGLNEGARRMASAQDQCYESRILDGVSPTQAYETCANEQTLGSVAARLPAAKSILDFIRDYTSVQPTAALTAWLGLLPDARVGENGLEVTPPRITLYRFNRNVEDRVGNALQHLLAGETPRAIADCTPESYVSAPVPGSDACIPPGFAGLIRSSAFLSARQLSPTGRELYREALAAQIAITTTRGVILDLLSQVKQLNVREGSGAGANDLLERRKELEEQIGLLQREADALQAFQQAKANTIRTQILAMDLSSAAVAPPAVPASAHAPAGFVYDALRALMTN